MNKICVKVGVFKGLIFYYFGFKEKFYIVVVSYVVDFVIKEVCLEGEYWGDFVEMVIWLMKMKLDFNCKYFVVFGLIM